MRFLLISSLFAGGAFLFPAASLGNQQTSLVLAAADNANSRYTVESVELAGEPQPDLPPTLQKRFAGLIGSRFDPVVFDELAAQIQHQLRLRSVRSHILRGSAPDRVRVQFEIERRVVQFDLSVPKFLYHSSQGWSAQLQASTTVAQRQVFRFGLVSDGDELIERFSGIDAGYQNLRTGSSRIATGILVQDFVEQWNPATKREPAASALLYSSRRNVQPYAVIFLARPLTVTAGASFEEMRMLSTGTPDRAANILFIRLDYRGNFEGTATGQRRLSATYELRFAPGGLGTDYRYTRNRAALHYAYTLGRSTIEDEMVAGVIAGDAPLFERFVLGNGSLLRGWNRYEIDPLGGNRIVHNSVQYDFRMAPGTVQVFFDSGALWSPGQSVPVRHSTGVGFRKGVFSVAIAIPLREGRLDPAFMLGMNY